MTASNPNNAALDWIKIVLMLAPVIGPVIKDVVALFKAHPQLTPEQLVTIVAAIRATGDDTLAIIAADKATNP